MGNLIDKSNIKKHVEYANALYADFKPSQIALFLFGTCKKKMPCAYISEVFKHEDSYSSNDKLKFSPDLIRSWLRDKYKVYNPRVQIANNSMKYVVTNHYLSLPIRFNK